MNKKVVKCRITDQPKSLFDPMPEVYVTLENETNEIRLFSYYPDEISFRPEEFIGLTINECRGLYTKKDKGYLLS
jgi:hypothetical protein